jgi:23S rRNA (guanosine2251-2'-O)-methyltransferase
MSSTDQFLYGYRAVRELLDSGNPVKQLWIEKGNVSPRKDALLDACRERGIPVREKTRRFLDKILKSERHQGIAATYVPRERRVCFESGTPPRTGAYLCLYLDRIQDPLNLGAIVRSAEFFGVDQVFYPHRRGAPFNAAAVKASAGAGAHQPPSRVLSPAGLFERFKRHGFHVVGTCPESGIPPERVDFSRDTVLVVGHEGDGISPRIRKYCDTFVRLAPLGHVASLNASAFTAVLLDRVRRFRQSSSRPAPPRVNNSVESSGAL